MHRTLETHSTHSQSAEMTRVRRLKRMLDYVIMRAAQTGVSEDDPIVAQVIENMKEEMQTPENVTFSDLEGLALLAHQKPAELDIIEPVISDTADLLLGNLDKAVESERKSNIGLSSVWSSIKAWDETRNESTSRLCVRMLNDFRHSTAQEHLAKAYIKAREEKISFDDALDAVNLQLVA